MLTLVIRIRPFGACCAKNTVPIEEVSLRSGLVQSAANASRSASLSIAISESLTRLYCRWLCTSSLHPRKGRRSRWPRKLPFAEEQRWRIWGKLKQGR